MVCQSLYPKLLSVETGGAKNILLFDNITSAFNITLTGRKKNKILDIYKSFCI